MFYLIMTGKEQVYLDLIIERIRVCRTYKPKFGTRGSVSATEFEALYGSDPFYAWFGLNDPLIYAAHKAAGGITSLYRQIGIGCEQMFRLILQDQLGLSPSQVNWAYSVGRGSKSRALHLDGRIQLSELSSASARQRCQTWLDLACKRVGVNARVAKALTGMVFEVRQGYKSKDSKRQNADIGNAGKAYQSGYLPIALILSAQIDTDVAERYQDAGWLLLQGTLNHSPVDSTFAFCKEVLQFDLAEFFASNSELIKVEIRGVLKEILTPT